MCHRSRVSHIPLWEKIRGEVVVVCDINKTKAQRVAEKSKVPHVFEGMEELLKMEQIEAVDICTPTQSHISCHRPFNNYIHSTA